MDNEEIKELLRELKETSDESTSVKSKVVKIHFDTQREAEKRAREKERARQEAERARAAQEEEEKRRREDQARIEAEQKERLVAEAKEKAQAVFSPDLPTGGSQDEGGGQDFAEEEETGSDLDLNWNPPALLRRTGGLLDRLDPEEDDPEDEEPGEDDQKEQTEEGSLSRRLVGRLRGGMNSLINRLARQDEEDREEESRKDAAAEEEDDEDLPDQGAEEDADTGDEGEEDLISIGGESEKGDLPQEDASAPDSSSAKTEGKFRKRPSAGKGAEDWKRRMEEPPRFNLRHIRIPDMPVKEWIREKDQDDFESDAADFRSQPLQATHVQPGQPPQTEPGMGAGTVQTTQEGLGLDPQPGQTGEGKASRAIEEKGPQSIELVDLNENANHKQVRVIDLDDSATGPLPALSEAGSGGPEASKKRFGRGISQILGKAAGSLAGKLSQSFGRINAEGPEKTGHKKDRDADQVSVADILKGTALPEEGRTAAGTQTQETGKVGSKAARSKKILALVFLGVGILLAGILIALAVSSGKDGGATSSGSGVTADDGLTVRIRQQPMEYVKEGEITLSIRAPKPIQSITADGKSVPFEGTKKTEIHCRTEKSSLELMVVSTDKVRSARIKLAYVDSEPPTVTVSHTGGRVVLTAKDDLSGVAGIYYGTCGDFSDVPLYEKYEEPFEEDPDAVYFWYAEDLAGNRSVPVSGSFTQAESISFEKGEMTLYSGQNLPLKVITSPKRAYLSGLTFTSSDSNVARIDQGSLLVPVSKGTCQVKAAADGVRETVMEVAVSDAKTVTISAVGDLTLGTDPSMAADTSFPAFQIVHGNSYFFRNVREILSQDDATIGNLEGALTTSETRQDKKFTFKGDPSYTDILKDGSIEVVSLANNHSGDYGEDGLTDTRKNLDQAGIDWCSGADIAYQELNGVKCAFIGIYAVENGLQSLDQVKDTVAEAKSQDAQLILVYFHWNSELVQDPNQDMITLGHAAVDAGADLVVGSHSHLVSGIEKYQGRYIVYGLSNFCFGGNLHPRSMQSMIFRQTFRIGGEEQEGDEDQIEIIPVLISSDPSYNNYQPTPATGADADAIIDQVNQSSVQFGTSWDQYMTDGTGDGAGKAEDM